MTTFLIILGILAALLAALFIYAASKPDTFQIQRAATIQAPPEKIFPLFNDFHNWTSWSPWEKMDPNLKRTYSGPASGPGAVYEWEGNKKVGQGRMEIAETSPPSKLTIKLDFLKPFKAHNTTVFTLVPQGNSTNVTWTMHGQQPFVFKVMTTFINMDEAIGKDFEAGLANLKSIAERA